MKFSKILSIHLTNLIKEAVFLQMNHTSHAHITVATSSTSYNSLLKCTTAYSNPKASIHFTIKEFLETGVQIHFTEGSTILISSKQFVHI